MNTSPRTDHRREISRALMNVAEVCADLGIERSKTERGKWRCPSHGGTSLSVRPRADGLQVRCFGCDLAGDVFTLIAAARGLDVRRDFAKVLAEGAALAHLWAVADELEGRPVARVQRPAPAPPPIRATNEPERTYPAIAEVCALWESSGFTEDDAEVCAMLTARALPPALIDLYALARVLPAAPAPLPSWARVSGLSWRDAGYRLIVPMYDAHGEMRSLRAWRIGEGDGQKRIAPAGHLSGGLVFACGGGRVMLTGERAELGARTVVIVEGDPDFLTWATKYDDAALSPPLVLGVVSGAWRDEVAARIPDGSTIAIRTHHDPPGDKYAEAINQSLRKRCRVMRSRKGSGTQ